MEENEGLIDQVELLDIKENDSRLIFLGLGNVKVLFFPLGNVFFLFNFVFSFFSFQTLEQYLEWPWSEECLTLGDDVTKLFARFIV